MAREPADIESLYTAHRDSLLTWFARRTGDAEVALDLWAETFAQATKGRRRYRGRTDDEAAGWLYGIARRQLACYHRRGAAERRARDRLKIERPEPALEVLDEIERRAGLRELRHELAAALATLSDPVRDAVALRVVHELGYPDVAHRLCISEPAARARVSRGLSALADAVDRQTVQEVLTP